MPRQLKTGAEIRDEISRVVQLDESIQEDDENVEVSLPSPLQIADDTGCNWTMLAYHGSSAYSKIVASAVQNVQARWNLIA